MFSAMPYSQWADTAHALHMILQMMGKVKLKRMYAQPEWNHALLTITPTGFTTGLIPCGTSSIDISCDISASQVVARCTSGLSAAFPMHSGKSIRDYFDDFNAMLTHIGHETLITKTPQEVVNTTPFDQQLKPLDYDPAAIRNYYEACVFAHNALLAFSSPLRSKKILPSMFWGTFDMTTVIFNGIEKPFPGEGLIEKVAFDEQFIEFGFWPGDPNVEDPSFFVLPYPFLDKDFKAPQISPAEAFYSPEKKEYFLKLKDVLTSDDPGETVRKFCAEAFEAVATAEGWSQVQWYTKPLLC